MKSFVNFKDQVCLITGAGSETGIGFNAAKILEAWEEKSPW